jgi:serine/threonine protein kinase
MPIGLYTAQLNFETLQEIGQEGKNSQVFLSHDKQLDGLIVVKKIEKAKLKHADEYYKESKILHLSAHPYVVRVNYGCSDDKFVYVAMPYYKNGSLKSLIDQRSLSIREVIRYSVQFLSGLNNIHSKGLIHFDVKPDNVLISDSNEALLSDFGLSKAMDDLGFANPDGIYKKQVPPEVFSSSNKTLHFDIYLAGLTIYRLLNGNSHYYSQLNFSTHEDYKNAIIEGKFPDRNNYLPHIPIKLQRIVNKALNVNIEDRYNNVLELINELSSVDENLDLIYSNNGSTTEWKLNKDGKLYVITLDSSDINNQEIVTYKTILNKPRTTKVHGLCRNNLTSRNILSNLKAVFRGL